MTNEEFLNYCSHGYIKKIKEGLNDKNVDPGYRLDEAFRTAVDEQNLEVVKLLLTDPRVDPNVLNTIGLRLALQDFDHPMIELLLSDERVDPSFENNWALGFLGKCSKDMNDLYLNRISSDTRVINKAVELNQLEYLPNNIKDIFVF